VVDDILDVTADSATLGKTAGKDALADKPTYVSVLGLERSRRYARELLAAGRTARRSGARWPRPGVARPGAHGCRPVPLIPGGPR
jgi:geranylgeranyl pyrophosphate synthase